MTNPSRTVALAIAVAVVMIAQQLAGRAVRDAYFLSHYPSSALPTFTMAAAILSIASVFATGALYRRYPPRAVLPWAFAGSGLWFALEWGLSLGYPRLAAASLFVHTTSFGAIVISGFWSVVNEALDPHTAKRAIGRIAGGATLGGVLGGLAAWRGASFASIELMILALGFVNLVCFVLVRGMPEGGGVSAPEKGKPPPSAIAVFEETPYLRNVAVLVMVSALAAAAFDYVFKARAAAAFDGSEALVGFFAQFYLALGIGTFLLQLFAGRAVTVIGLSWSVAMMPLAVVGLGLVALWFGGLGPVVALRGGVAVLESSVYRSGYEVLFTPLTPEKKRPTKTLIDVGGDKLGAAMGGAVALVLIDSLPQRAEEALLIFAVLCGGCALLITRQLHRGYVGSLADSLRSGTLPASLQTGAGADPAARGSATQAARGSASLLAGAPSDLLAPSRGPTDWSDLAGSGPPLERGLRALRSKDPERMRAALRLLDPLPSAAVPTVLEGLARPDLRAELIAALERSGPRHLGAMTDVLLSARFALEARVQIPALLARIPTRRSLFALRLGLETEPFSLRYRVGEALRALASEAPDLVLDGPTIEAAVMRVVDEERWDAVSKARSLAFAQLLLSTILPAEPLRLALEALAAEDPARRGTGLEYMENVVPRELRPKLQPLMEVPELARVALEPEKIEPSVHPPRTRLSTLIERLRALETKV